MWHLSASILALSARVALSFCLLEDPPIAAKSAPRPEPKTIVLTAESHDAVVKARVGDTLELRLPASMPMSWILVGDSKILKEIRVDPKNQNVKRLDPKQKNKPVGLSDAYQSGSRYQILAPTKGLQTVQWMYCKFGSVEKTKKLIAEHQAPSPGPFIAATAMGPTGARLGMEIRVKLSVEP